MLALFVKIPTSSVVYKRSAVFLRIPNILQITVCYSIFHISAGHAYARRLVTALLVAKYHKPTMWTW